MIIKFFIYCYSLIRLGYSVVLINTLYYRSGLYRLIKESYASVKEPINLKYRKRIYYHGMLGSITNVWFTVLRGKSQTIQEALAGFYLGAATAVYDDLFDHYDYTMDESLVDLAGGQYKYGNITELLSKRFYDVILNNLKDPTKFNYYLQKVGYEQEASKAQVGGNLSFEEIRKITYDKGSYSVALSRSILQHTYVSGEAEAVYILGKLIQLTDDVFDVRRDYIEGVDTLLTKTKDILPIQKEYIRLINDSFEAFHNLNYNKHNFLVFCMQIMFVVSRGLVALDQLAKAQQRLNGIFDIENMTREELVCDMEKPSNIWKSTVYTLRWDYPKCIK